MKSANIDLATTDVEDSIILDPYLLKIVNGYREVEVNNNVYKLTRYGTFICTEDSRFTLRELLNDEGFRRSMAQRFEEHVKSTVESDSTTTLKKADLLPDGEYVADQVYYVYPIEDDPYGGGWWRNFVHYYIILKYY